MARPPVEGLETRRLLSATLSGGTVFVLGSSLRENIFVYETVHPETGEWYLSVMIDWPKLDRPAITRSFPLDKVNSVYVRSGGGNDVVDLAIQTIDIDAVDVRPASVPARVDGGIGSDVLYGGSAGDVIHGSFGDDAVFAMGGRDRVFGGSGNDTIRGGEDGDVLQGNGGNDDIRGGDGNDVVFGNDGNDRLGGDEGDDRLYGGAGDDWLGSVSFGPLPREDGDDVLSGGPGADRLLGGPGTDRIYGNDGRDTFYDADDESEMKDRTPDEPIEPWADPV